MSCSSSFPSLRIADFYIPIHIECHPICLRLQRFETVASLAASQDKKVQKKFVWWDTRLGAGAGGCGALGLRLGQGGQIKELDLSIETTIYSKVLSTISLSQYLFLVPIFISLFKLFR